MRGLKTALGMVVGASVLTACFEAQPAPDLPHRSSKMFNITEVETGLNKPWSVAELPNGEFLMTEKSGKLRRTSVGGQPLEINGLPSDIFASGQGGVLDIVLAPDFETTSEVYLSYSYGDVDSNGTALLRAKLTRDTLENVRVIFRASPPKAGPAR